MTTPIEAALIPGDGIGPKIVDATLAAFDALRAPFVSDRQIAGLGGVQLAADPLASATLDSTRRTAARTERAARDAVGYWITSHRRI